MNLLQQFVDFLTAQRRKPSFLTVKNYKADIKQFINWFEGGSNSPFDPSKITLQTLEQYKKARNLSPVSFQRHVSSLRKFFHFLKFEGIISADPLEKRIASAQALAKADPWMLKNFKNYLYESNKSNLTIKNYINDIKGFFVWLAEASLTKYAWDVTERNLLDKINFVLVDEYKQRLIAAKFSPRTINRKLSSLRNYITWAKNQGLIPPDQVPMSSRTSFGISGNGDEILKPASPRGEQVQHDTKETSYSSFPPLRLIQKAINGADFLFDALFILPLAKSIEDAQYLFWKVSGKKIFKKGVISSSLRAEGPNGKVLNIKKEFYAPLKVSTRYLPTHKRIWHILRHVRPNWYKTYHSYSITHYFHFAILIIVASAIGFGTYNGLFANTQRESSTLAATSFAPARILSFQGKLNDSYDNPITTTTKILFSIYNDQSASGTALWEETNLVKPDSDGIFSVFLGKNTPIPDTLFSQNPTLFLGITVGNDELSPRQQLATVPFANNAETLQGLEPITNTTKVSNVVLALDSGGNLSIAGSKAHTFQTIGGQFVLSGKILSLTTIPGSNSNIEIVPDGIGKIDLQKPIFNSSNDNNLSGVPGAVEFDDTVVILATTSAQAALYINQSSTGPLISASSSGTAKFVVENDGTGIFSGDLAINGGDLTSSSAIFNLLNSTVTTLNFAGAATSLALGAPTGTITLRNENAKIEGNVTLGKTTSNTITFNGRVAQDSSLVPATTSGTSNLGSSSLPWDNSYINNVYTLNLDVQDSQEATATAHIFNTSTGTNADGLVIKLGNTSTSTVSAANHFVSFETSGIGIVGSIQGSGGKGVTYATSGIADFAEYFKKDKNQIIEYGSIVCLKDNGLAIKCDNNNNRIIGVASEHPAFLGGENLGNDSIAVGLIGQVETSVSTLNGEIKAGDMLTASEIPGVSVKATKTGQIIGKALKDLATIDESKVVGYYDPDNKEYRSKTSFPDIPLKSNIIRVVKIDVLVNVSWYDPGAYLANTGDFIIRSTGSNGYSIFSKSNQTLTNIEGFFKVVASNIKAGLINASEVITSSLIVTTDTIIVNGQNVKDYIVGVVNENNIVSPIQTNEISTNIISPLGESLIVRLATPSAEIQNSEFIIQNSSGSAVAKIDDQGNASFSGQLISNSLTTDHVSSEELAVSGDASVSGTLRARNIIADSISGLAEKVSSYANIASFSANLAYVPSLQAEQGLFNQGLMVFGGTSLSDLSIVGNVSIGNTMFVTQNSIETLGTSLSLQSLRQGGLSIMGGLIYIDTDGNLKAQGDVSIMGKLAVNIISPLPTSDLVINNASGSGVLSVNQTGDIIASGSATFSKLNFSLIQPVLAVSATEVIASSSAGAAQINPYYTEVTIGNFLVTDKSVIYITPVGTPSAEVPFLMRQQSSEADSEQIGSFTVGVKSPTSKSIPFNWLIIN